MFAYASGVLEKMENITDRQLSWVRLCNYVVYFEFSVALSAVAVQTDLLRVEEVS